ncbi:MAG: TetR/AcrR family transcriptional regulator [Oscillospiraceae bacterium]|nr:TetR/AcrR family transcriptional regulator [Oscillospiraceae bacterium]
MKKNISREQIINTTLELMMDKSSFEKLNLREIARTLDCAHTNIYNYFPSFKDVLWAAHTALQDRTMEIMRKNLLTANTDEMKLHQFFQTILDVYLDNKGWFRLAWLEYIGDERPAENADAVQKARTVLNQYISEIWGNISGTTPDMKNIDQVLHNTHCYIIGEISNYISGRGLIFNESELKENVVKQAVQIFTLSMRGIRNEL